MAFAVGKVRLLHFSKEIENARPKDLPKVTQSAAQPPLLGVHPVECAGSLQGPSGAMVLAKSDFLLLSSS